MKEMDLKTFLNHFCTIRTDKKFCFILGAGASKQSEIPTGTELVQKWITELHELHGEEEIKKWMKEQKIPEKHPESEYSKIYEKRFEIDRKDGPAFLESIMDGKEPSCGYSVLSQILSLTPHRIVITTNFDSLTEDALFIYTQKKPLVIGHESLAGFINLFGSRPLIVKVHRDLLFSPKNDSDATKQLEANIAKNLTSIFKYYTPLVIGYGGNDGSLMGFLESVGEIEGGMFWFYRKNDSLLSHRIKKLIEQFDGYAVAIDGFDELMIQLADKKKWDRLDNKIVETANQRAKSYREQIEKIQKAASSKTETKEALTNIIARGDKDWWYYETLASNEQDINKREEIYQEGIKEFPDSSELANNYAKFQYEIRKDYGKAEEYYKRALALNPKDAVFSNYANLLCDIRKDYEKAEEYYQQSLELNPNFANNVGNYANFLCNIRKDYTKAEEYYKRALELSPNNAVHIGNYAKFLIGRKKITEARPLILKALKINKNEETGLAIELIFYFYAVFWKDYPNAKEEIEKLLKEGVTSPGWYLDDILAVAKEMGHPDYDTLCEFAKRISAL